MHTRACRSPLRRALPHSHGRSNAVTVVLPLSASASAVAPASRMYCSAGHRGTARVARRRRDFRRARACVRACTPTRRAQDPTPSLRSRNSVLCTPRRLSSVSDGSARRTAPSAASRGDETLARAAIPGHVTGAWAKGFRSDGSRNKKIVCLLCLPAARSPKCHLLCF